MTETRINHFVEAIVAQTNIRKIAQTLAEIDEQLAPQQGQLFLRLDLNEHSYPEIENRKKTGKRRYQIEGSVTTGLFTGLSYRPGNEDLARGAVTLDGQETFCWDSLFLNQGPTVRRIGPISNDLYGGLKILTGKDQRNGILVWNGHLPIAYQEGFLETPGLFKRLRYAPDALPETEFESIAMIIGNEAVAQAFGLERTKGIVDTISLYRGFLALNGLDPKIAAEWKPETTMITDASKRAELFRPLESKLHELPYRFFAREIFDRYPIRRPASYDKVPTDAGKL